MGIRHSGPGVGVIPPKDESIVAHLISAVRANADGSCDAEFEVGEAGPKLKDWADSHNNNEQSQPTQQGNGGGGPKGRLAGVAAHNAPPGYVGLQAYSYGYINDPIPIWVNWVKTSVDWWYNPSDPNAPIYPTNGQYSRDWRASTGWTLAYESWQTYAIYPSQTTTTANVEFQNFLFPACYLQTVYADYWPIYINGYGTGAAFGNFTWYLTGSACKNLLTPYLVVRKVVIG
jgi:hypothetical protein